MIDMFASDTALAQWEAEPAPLRGAGRLRRVFMLAWHLRQRDPARARWRVKLAPWLQCYPKLNVT